MSWKERVLVWRAAMALVSGTYAVKICSYPMLRQRISQSPVCANRIDPGISIERILEVLRAVGRRIPGGACLSQAIAAREVLAQYGYRSTLKIGVALEEPSGFLAHAWLELDGRVILGGTDSSSRYAALEIAHTSSRTSNP